MKRLQRHATLPNAATREFWKATDVLPAAAIMTEALGLDRAKIDLFALLDAEGWRLGGACETALEEDDLECAPDALREVL